MKPRGGGGNENERRGCKGEKIMSIEIVTAQIGIHMRCIMIYVFNPFYCYSPLSTVSVVALRSAHLFYCGTLPPVTSNKAHLHSNFIRLLMRLLKDEIHHLPDLIGRHIIVTVVFTRRRWICQSPPKRNAARVGKNKIDPLLPAIPSQTRKGFRVTPLSHRTE